MEQNMFRESAGSTACQKITALLRNRKFHTYCDHNSLPLDPVLSHFNPVHIITSYLLIHYKHVPNIQGLTMAQAFSRRPLTAEARVCPCGICGGQSGTDTGFSPSSSLFYLSISFHSGCPNSYIIWRMINYCPLVAVVQRRSLTSSTRTTYPIFASISSRLLKSNLPTKIWDISYFPLYISSLHHHILADDLKFIWRKEKIMNVLIKNVSVIMLSSPGKYAFLFHILQGLQRRL
jgi:hypothetical protein